MYVDSHCHLSFEGLHERIDDVRAAMAAADVDRAVAAAAAALKAPVTA
jgi:TatD DNase family protein